MRTSICILLPAVLLSVAFSGACRKAPVRTSEVVAAPSAEIPLDPASTVWERAPEHVARLLLQDLVEPRLMEPSTAEVLVRALTNGTDVAFRLQWRDPEANDLPGAGRFVDACAIQIPMKTERELPAPQMGEAGRGVEITFWRADWQAWVNGRGDAIRDLYPNASIDHYPFEAPSLEPGSPAQKEMASRYAPAQALGNRRAGPRDNPVEDMIATGPGTLEPAASTTSRGRGVRTRDGWAVVLARRLPADLAPHARGRVAFAVWEGSHQESGARKMRTGWIPLLIQEGK